MVSIVEVFSASSVLTYRSQNYLGPISYHTFTIIIGAAVAIIVQNIPYQKFRQMIPFLTLFSAFTLLWVLLAGTKVGDAGRWLYLFGFSFQPSEIAKGTIVLTVSQILARLQLEKGADENAFKWILWITIPTCILIGLENLSTAAMLFFVVGLVPVTGQPLPLVSKGGTSTIINCAYIGAILSISRLR